MRVIQVAPAGVHPYSGITTVVTELTVALTRTGVDTEVWQLSDSSAPDVATMRSPLERSGIQMALVPVASRFRLGPQAARRAEATVADVAHLHGVFNLHNVLLARKLPMPYMVSPHGSLGSEALQYHAWRKRAARLVAELPMLNRAAVVCALSEVEADELRRFGVTAPIEIVSNGTRPAPQVYPGAFRRRLGLTTQPLAVYTGRLDLYHKNLEELARGLVGALNWHAAFVGPSFRRGQEALRALAQQLGVDDRLHLPGPLGNDDLYEALAAADVFALPSRWEGFPMSLLEAASTGTPALISEAVEARVRLASEGGAIVVGTGTWSSALRSWEGMPEQQRTDMAQAALRFADDRRWEKVVPRYVEVYESAR